MDRRQADALLLDYLYGELGPAENAAMEAYLRSEPDYANRLEALEQVRQVAQTLDKPEPSPVLSDKILKQAALVFALH